MHYAGDTVLRATHPKTARHFGSSPFFVAREASNSISAARPFTLARSVSSSHLFITAYSVFSALSCTGLGVERLSHWKSAANATSVHTRYPMGKCGALRQNPCAGFLGTPMPWFYWQRTLYIWGCHQRAAPSTTCSSPFVSNRLSVRTPCACFVEECFREDDH